MTGTITPIGVGTAALYSRLATAGTGIDMLVDPGNTNAPIIFEPPSALSGGDLEIWLIASGGAEWGGCQVWVSSDGNTYALAGTLYAGARQGVLTAPLPSHADPDTADTLSVDLTESQGQMLSGTQADADNLVTLCYCDGELVSYQTPGKRPSRPPGLPGTVQSATYMEHRPPGLPGTAQGTTKECGSERLPVCH